MTSRPSPESPPHALELGKLVYTRYPMQRDRDEFVTLRRKSKSFLQRWEPRAPAGFDAFGDDQFDWMLKSRRKPDQERYFIFTLSERVLVGQLSLGCITRGPLQSAYLGYWIGERFAGKGYMSEAIGLTLRHAFRGLALHRVEANIQPHNAPSKAVAKKCGFRLEGFSPGYLNIDGVWADHERWAITIEDWKAGAAPLRRARSNRARSRAAT